jgi:hypothetical protein
MCCAFLHFVQRNFRPTTITPVSSHADIQLKNAFVESRLVFMRLSVVQL